MAHLPTYSSTSIAAGTGIFVVLLVGTLIAAWRRRPPRDRRRRPRR